MNTCSIHSCQVVKLEHLTGIDPPALRQNRVVWHKMWQQKSEVCGSSSTSSSSYIEQGEGNNYFHKSVPHSIRAAFEAGATEVTINGKCYQTLSDPNSP